MMFGNLGMGELLIILAIVVLLFGARKLPDIGRGLGEAIRGFRSGLKSDEADQNKGGGEPKKGAGA
jgi:sec-independent protein translocase protein TatA